MQRWSDVTSHFRQSATVVCDYCANVSISLILIGTKWPESIKVSVIMGCRFPYRHYYCRCQCVFCWSSISFLRQLMFEIEIPAGSIWITMWQQRKCPEELQLSASLAFHQLLPPLIKKSQIFIIIHSNDSISATLPPLSDTILIKLHGSVLLYIKVKAPIHTFF